MSKKKLVPDRVRVTGVDLYGQTPLLQHRRFGEEKPRWLLWLSYSINRTSGTYLVLHDNGAIWRETLHPDGSVQTVIITPASV